uniref:transglycosylase domain-containing protein n=1 Tax=Streptomyces corallincola TaxID=2851888 RepID=UPI001FE47E5E|nr:transglycosylase domain-containing protein [Streptomyces corallincola]
MRRVNAPRAPKDAATQATRAAGAAEAAESTQVLRRANAPREPEQPKQGQAKQWQANPGQPKPGESGGERPQQGRPQPGRPGPTGATTSASGAAGVTAPIPRTPTPVPPASGNPSGPAGPSGPTGPGGGGGGNGDGSGGGDGKKPKKRKRTGWRRLLPTWRMLLGTAVLGVLAVIGLFFVGYSMVQIPSANALAIKQGNVYLYADGSQLARDGEINREIVSLAQMSKAAQHAVLAAEDRDFYTESAIDPKAMLRAGWNTATGKGKQSGSTITQQYVKNYYLAQEQTVTRKAKEFFISVKLDRTKSKNDILAGYLNTSYFGRNAYGIQAAAQAYYGVDATDLDPARAAYLAALVNAPSEYDVVAHPENKPAALARWNYVLDGMVKKGWLAESERQGMKFPMPKEQTVSTGLSGQRGYLVEAVKDYLTEHKILTREELQRGGYRITTTFDRNKQNAFEKAVNDQLISKLDKKNRKADTYVRAGGASVDPRTGKVVAIYGGIDYVKQYTNGATRGDFQVGSTFKPFVFTSAVQNSSTTQDGRPITPTTYYDGTSSRPVKGWSGGPYAPENEDEKSYGQITVSKATDLSVNSVYAQMAVDVGPAKVRKTAVDLGIPEDTKDLQPYPSIALGTANASVLDMAEAYATLANHGEHGTYTMIDKITKDGTDVIRLPGRDTRQAVSREAADTTTSVLRSVVQSGTAIAAQAAGRPAAGKTGTAEEDTAAWFAGYTPDLATVVSVMGQDPVTAQHKSLYNALGVPRMNGGGPPTAIWAQYTRAALKGKPVADFDLQLMPDADKPQQPTGDPSAPPATPGDGGTTTTGGQTDGAPSGTPTDGTAGTPGDGGATNGGTPPDGGATTDGGTTTGTTGGTPGGGTADGGATGTPGGAATGGGTPGGAAGGGPAGGGTAGTSPIGGTFP